MSFHKLFNKTNFTEFDRIPITGIRGKIPSNLSGALFRNTSVCLERAGTRLSHWFDGDGAILRLNFHNSSVEASYKFVRTEAYKKESAAGRFIFPNIGNLAHTFLDRLRYPNFPVNRANTSVLPLENKLLALWEGGKPHSLDLETLETKGEDDLGYLSDRMSYTAHPKIDPQSGFVYNIGQRKGAYMIDVYVSDGKTGQILKHNAIKFDKNPIFIHDMCLAGDYLVFFTFPIKLDLLSVFLRRKTLKDALEYDENSYSEIVIVSKKSLELVAKIKHDPFFFFHFSNGFVNEKGNLVFDLCEYENFDVFKKYTSSVLQKNYGAEIDEKKNNIDNKQNKKKQFNAFFSRFEIDLQNKKLVAKNKIIDDFCEFPIVPSNSVGKKYSKVYLSQADEGSTDYLKNAVLLDIDKQILNKKKFEDGVFPGEVIHIESTPHRKEGYAITVAYDAIRDKSTVYLMDENSLEDVAVFDLPDVTAHSFHGIWKSHEAKL